MARSTLTDEVQERICSALRAGNYQETAVRYAGVSESVYYKWLKMGRDAMDKEDRTPLEARCVEFVDAVEKARADAEVRNVHHIQQAAQGGTWQASAWFLERSFPARWGRREKVEHSGPDGGPITLQGLARLMEVEEDG